MGASWIKHFKQEFALEKRSLKARDPQLILRSQWGVHPVLWLFYRIIVMIYTLIWCIASGVQTNSPKWFIFLTHITYIILTIYFILALVNLICYMALGQKRSEQNIGAASLEEISSYSPAIPEIEDGIPSQTLRNEYYAPSTLLYPTICIQWVLHNLTCVTALFVTVAFWSFDYIPGRLIDSTNINMHVINSVLVLLELSVTAAPIHLAHFVYTLTYCLTFVVFTVIYWAAGGTNLRGKPYIYRSLNYEEKPGPAVGFIIVSICILIPLLQFLVWNLHFLRRHLYLKYNRKDGEVPHC
ncbi:protein rolling stone-like isoform X1 [Scyliorhinus canicula]|uniref:protein rolling stone-like isoform X1 n=1 Tax=Scyliorhinus canicula TaxID=7830 RepID=UPI0018F731C2|nr:protein rolling stone-like isoform X1 [Scyliorhinus canicula]